MHQVTTACLNGECKVCQDRVTKLSKLPYVVNNGATMLETRRWAKLSDDTDGSARYIVPTICLECSLELHHWVNGSKWELFTIFPKHQGTFWWRLRNCWKYVRTGYWPHGDICLEKQDLKNLSEVLDIIGKVKEVK